ncbi:MAG: tRNA uridine-5-carboxymethylaminomethyl(34) synthesis GTPase MnmE [Defluviitaleaceae bacterium]|nr:tRNA uridine-5-carboxymethylaminomethyl(34) synthesis GTPase MnmE [Defluviitaleaceae bacterium]
MNKDRDVIAAIATAHGQGAIGIVRLSGAGVLQILEKMFWIKAEKYHSHTMYYGNVHKDNEVIDEAMLCYMKAPRSFTREDSAEIYAHGGVFVLGEVLYAALEAGARLAEPGEFTKRAFLNGRLNLSQAEAVMDLISAKNGIARRAALRQLGGGLSRRIEAVRDKILSWLANIELSIDYPEHEEEAKNITEILSESDEALADLKRLKETAGAGRIISEGVRTAIIGRPNVGKSTLINAMLHENRAIVHETAGTTRDILTEEIRIKDVPLIIMDTAGLRQTADPVEKIGIEKTHEAASDSELILFVADALCGLTSEDKEIIKAYEPTTKIIILMNKTDLHKTEPPQFCDIKTIAISAKNHDGLEDLYSEISKMFFAGSITAEGGEADIIMRERHKILLEQAIENIKKAKSDCDSGIPEDLISVPLRAAYINLGEILGLEIDDDIVDRIFDEFCVGK